MPMIPIALTMIGAEMDHWPRLTETLPLKEVDRCNQCGSKEGLAVWQEHNQFDKPQTLYVVLCPACSDRIIDPHLRLYRRCTGNEPTPGAMAQCIDCRFGEGTRCLSPKLRINNRDGEGISFKGPDSTVHMSCRDKHGKRYGVWEKHWKEVPPCPERQPIEELSHEQR